jgi:predicted DNA-binding transcriptional regulator AlpA
MASKTKSARKRALKKKSTISKRERNRRQEQAAGEGRLMLFRTQRLAALLDVNPATIWRWRRSGVLPPPVAIGSIHGWTSEQVAALLQQPVPAA